jgi:hypothetical protein
MQTLQTLFAVLLGIAALGALVAAVRAFGQGAPARMRGYAWLIFAVSAGAQVANLLLGYSWPISALSALGMVVGVWLGLPRPRSLS